MRLLYTVPLPFENLFVKNPGENPGKIREKSGKNPDFKSGYKWPKAKEAKKAKKGNKIFFFNFSGFQAILEKGCNNEKKTKISLSEKKLKLDSAWFSLISAWLRLNFLYLYKIDF